MYENIVTENSEFCQMKIKKTLSPFYHWKILLENKLGCLTFIFIQKYFSWQNELTGFFIFMWQFVKAMYTHVALTL